MLKELLLYAAAYLVLRILENLAGLTKWKWDDWMVKQLLDVLTLRKFRRKPKP